MVLNFDFLRLDKNPREKLLKLTTLGFSSVQVLFVSYILAGMVSNSMVMFLIDKAAITPSRVGGKAAQATGESFVQSSNYRELQKVIKARNIFNSEGAFPDELDPSEIQAQASLVFNENAPCQKTSLNIELVGTIYLGNSGSSLATIQEKGFTQADIYKAGDLVIGSDSAKIHRIDQKRVVINNNGKKECLELDADQNLLASHDMGANDVSPYMPSDSIAGGEDVGGCTSAVLEAKYVRDEIGTGFDKALSKGRLVPHNKDGQHVGYKMIGMEKNGLFGKSCIHNGDVITQVNETVLTPDQGFAFYEAYQQEQRIRVNLLRNGVTPMTVNIEIK